MSRSNSEGQDIFRSSMRIFALIALAGLISGCTPPALYSLDATRVRAALAQGADPNARWHSFTPLAIASLRYAPLPDGHRNQVPEEIRVEVARQLLDAGADPNKFTSVALYADAPPLIAAIRYCQSDMVRLLLDRGASPRGEFPVWGTSLIALAYACPKAPEADIIAGMLLDQVERTEGRAAMLEFAAQRVPAPKGIAYEQQDGMSALHVAAWLDRRGVLAAMLRKGADLDRLANVTILREQWTPLHVAVARGHAEIEKSLIAAGARADVRSGKGQIPAEIARCEPPKLATMARDVSTLAMHQRSGDVVGNAKIILSSHDRSRFCIKRHPLGTPASELPPLGWKGLEEALKKRAAVTAKSSEKPAAGKKPRAR